MRKILIGLLFLMLGVLGIHSEPTVSHKEKVSHVVSDEVSYELVVSDTDSVVVPTVLEHERKSVRPLTRAVVILTQLGNNLALDTLTSTLDTNREGGNFQHIQNAYCSITKVQDKIPKRCRYLVIRKEASWLTIG